MIRSNTYESRTLNTDECPLYRRIIYIMPYIPNIYDNMLIYIRYVLNSIRIKYVNYVFDTYS